MIQIKRITYPPKGAFGFFSCIPFWGANSKFRRKVKRILLSRASSAFQNEIEAMWSLLDLSAEEMREIRECIRKNIGWPNALFLPSDSFLALAPLEIDRYDAFAPDTDTVNDIFLILNPGVKETMKSDRSIGGALVRSAVRNGDLPLMDPALITPEHTILDVLQIILSEGNAQIGLCIQLHVTATHGKLTALGDDEHLDAGVG